MKKRIFMILVLSLVLVMALSGCGTKLHTLTDSEEDLIVHYAAYVLAKHNLKQPDGMNSAKPQATIDSQTTEETQTPSNTQEDTQDSDPNLVPGEVETPDNQKGEKLALAAALGYEGKLGVTYTGVNYATSFEEGDYYSVSAKNGMEFVIMHFDLTNLTDTSLAVDVFQNDLLFSISQDGTSWISQEQTYLIYDLSTFQGTIEPQETVSCVLLFQAKQGDVGEAQALLLNANVGGITYPVDGEFSLEKSNL